MEQISKREPTVAVRVFRFYFDGFRRMTIGKTLWKIIILKLIIMFGVLKVFFFQDFLETRFTTDEQRADYVLSELTRNTQAQEILQGGERK